MPSLLPVLERIEMSAEREERRDKPRIDLGTVTEQQFDDVHVST